MRGRYTKRLPGPDLERAASREGAQCRNANRTTNHDHGHEAQPKSNITASSEKGPIITGFTSAMG